MGSVYRETYTKPIPAGAELFTRDGKRFARWKNSKGRKQVSPVTTGKDGSDRLVIESPTYVAKYRDGTGLVCKVSTGCRDEDATRSVLSNLERRSELVKSEVLSKGEATMADHQATSIAGHFAVYLNHLRARDERGRSIDVHALRTSFGTLLSKAGVAPRTAQAAMRHSKIDLTMNVYTDPKLLDVAGAMDSLPTLDLNPNPSTGRQTMRATGTEDGMSSALVPPLVPNTGKTGQTVSFAVISSAGTDERISRRAKRANPMNSSKKALPAVFADKAFRVETTGIEPVTSGLQSQRSPN